MTMTEQETMRGQQLPTVEEVFAWMRKLYDESYSGLTKTEKNEQHMYGTMVTTPSDKKFIVRMLDETSQVRDTQKLAIRVKELIDQYGIPKFLSTGDHFLFWMYQKFAYLPLFNWVAVPIIKWRLRRDTSRVIIDAARPHLTRHLATRFDQNIGQNVNLLGEVVLGDGEADKRYYSYLDALKEPDINYISVKISGIYAQTHALNYKECFPELVRRMSELYQTAIDHPYTDPEGVTRPKFINLDMEEYKDAHLTMKLFKDVLSLPQFKMMKPNARIANVARGGIVNEDDLYTALKEKIIAGAAFDVWCNEPLTDDEKKLLELDNLVTTPHLGASTVEAQERVAIEVAEHAVMYLKDGIVSNAINAPRGALDSETEPYMPLVKTMGSIIQQIVGNHPLNKLEISYCGTLAKKQTKLLTVTTIIGYLEGIIGTANMINALPIAKSKGIEIFEASNEVAKDYSGFVEMKFSYNGMTRSLRGTVIGGSPKILGLDEYATDITVADKMIFIRYNDTPGVIGAVGNAIGEAGINIAHMAVGRAHGKATMFLTIDQDVPDEVINKIETKVGAEEAKYIRISQ